jgi:hypothetical protein
MRPNPRMTERKKPKQTLQEAEGCLEALGYMRFCIEVGCSNFFDEA